jgi:uncharacterized protein YqfB (UPF0267 family)
MNDITFYQRFEADILAGRKTITIRDKSESHFKAGDILRVGRFEDNTIIIRNTLRYLGYLIRPNSITQNSFSLG